MPPPITPLQKEWLEFKAAAVPETACEAQINDMKTSFCAGVLVATRMFMQITESMNEDDGVIALQMIVNEANAEIQKSAGIHPSPKTKKPH